VKTVSVIRHVFEDGNFLKFSKSELHLLVYVLTREAKRLRYLYC